MKHFWTGLLALGVVGCTAPQQTQKDNISGIYPKLAFYNNEGECGMVCLLCVMVCRPMRIY